MKNCLQTPETCSLGWESLANYAGSRKVLELISPPEKLIEAAVNRNFRARLPCYATISSTTTFVQWFGVKTEGKRGE